MSKQVRVRGPDDINFGGEVQRYKPKRVEVNLRNHKKDVIQEPN